MPTRCASPAAADQGTSVQDAEPDDPEPDRHKAWARTTWEALRPFGQGVYVNFLSDEAQSHVKVAYGDQKYNRLAELKSKYDPTNFFRFNQNITPSSSGGAAP